MSNPFPAPAGHVRMMRCMHGTNFVTLGNVTLHLSDAELVLVDRAIHAMARREPALWSALLDSLLEDASVASAASMDSACGGAGEAA